jgi:hypothetical protein
MWGGVPSGRIMVGMSAHNTTVLPRSNVVVVCAESSRPEELTVTTESLRL